MNYDLNLYEVLLSFHGSGLPFLVNIDNDGWGNETSFSDKDGLKVKYDGCPHADFEYKITPENLNNAKKIEDGWMVNYSVATYSGETQGEQMIAIKIAPLLPVEEFIGLFSTPA
jgi:hypothetical protein